MRPLWTAILIAALFTAPTVRADCSCLCIDGDVQAVCDNSFEPRPLCGPTFCAPVPVFRQSEPLVASPGKEWVYASPPETKLGDDSYEWVEAGVPDDIDSRDNEVSDTDAWDK